MNTTSMKNAAMTVIPTSWEKYFAQEYISCKVHASNTEVSVNRYWCRLNEAQNFIWSSTTSFGRSFITRFSPNNFRKIKSLINAFYYQGNKDDILSNDWELKDTTKYPIAKNLINSIEPLMIEAYVQLDERFFYKDFPELRFFKEAGINVVKGSVYNPYHKTYNIMKGYSGTRLFHHVEQHGGDVEIAKVITERDSK